MNSDGSSSNLPNLTIPRLGWWHQFFLEAACAIVILAAFQMDCRGLAINGSDESQRCSTLVSTAMARKGTANARDWDLAFRACLGDPSAFQNLFSP